MEPDSGIGSGWEGTEHAGGRSFRIYFYNCFIFQHLVNDAMKQGLKGQKS